jgi:trigger factor
LEITKNAINESLTEASFTYSFDDIAADFQKEYAVQIKRINLPGFRPGKAPKQMVEQRFGAALMHESAERVANEKFFQWCKNENVQVYGTPAMTEFDFDADTKLSFKVKYEHTPVFELNQYKDIVVEVTNLEATGQIVEDEYSRALEQDLTREPAEVVEDNNFAVQAVLIKTNPEEGEKVEPVPMNIHLNWRSVNDQLRQSIMQKRVGDSFEFTVDDHHTHKKEDGAEEEHAVTFIYTGTIEKIERLIPPVLDEAYFKKVSKNAAVSESEYKEYLRGNIQTYFNERMEEDSIKSLDDKLVALNPFAVPPSFVEHLVQHSIEKQQAESKKTGKTLPPEYLKKIFQPQAEHAARLMFIHDKIRAAENFSITDEIITEHARNNAAKIGVEFELLADVYKSNPKMRENVERAEFSKFLLSLNRVEKVEKKVEHNHEGHHHE